MFQNAVLDRIHQDILRLWTIPTCQLQRVYTNTTENAKLRLYIINITARGSEPGLVLTEDNRDRWCEEALFDLARVLWMEPAPRPQSKDELESWDLCRYHVHEVGVCCGK
jgi:hypothetical protein